MIIIGSASFRVARFLALVSLVAGCSVQPRYDAGLWALNAGNLNLAETEANWAAQRGDPAGFNNLGAVAMRRGDRALAVKWYNIAARMGAQVARANLIQLGEPVPQLDLLAPGQPAPISPSSPGTKAAGAAIEAIIAGVNGYMQGHDGDQPGQQINTVASPKYKSWTPAPRGHTAFAAPLLPPPPRLELPPPRCRSQSIRENGRTRYVRVCD